jgi:hypothetical protein
MADVIDCDFAAISVPCAEEEEDKVAAVTAESEIAAAATTRTATSTATEVTPPVPRLLTKFSPRSRPRRQPRNRAPTSIASRAFSAASKAALREEAEGASNRPRASWSVTSRSCPRLFFLSPPLLPPPLSSNALPASTR